MYTLQVFDIEPTGRPVRVVHVGVPFQTVSEAAREAWRLALATNYRVTDETGHIVCEDRLPDEVRHWRAAPHWPGNAETSCAATAH
jgi:hypothetical protein